MRGDDSIKLIGKEISKVVEELRNSVLIIPPEVDEDFCIGCGICVKVCPVEVIKLESENILDGVMASRAKNESLPKRMVKVALILFKTHSLPEICIKCRRCVEECPTDARTF